MRIDELMDTVYSWIQTKDISSQKHFVFKTKENEDFKVVFFTNAENDIGGVGVGKVGEDGPGASLGSSNALGVFNTVGAILKDFIQKYKPKNISLMAMGQKRYNIYKYILKKVMLDEPYSIEMYDDNYVIKLTRKNI